MLKFKKLISVLMIAFIMLGVVQPVFAASGTGTWVGQQYESNIKTTEYEGKPYGIYLRKLRNTATGKEKTVFCAEHGIGFYSRVNYNGSFYTVTDPTMKKACKIAYFGWYQKYGDYVVGDDTVSGAKRSVMLDNVFTQQYIWEVIDNAKIDQNKIIILDGSKYTKVCYANYNVMMPGATKIANAQYNSELLINLFSEKPYCTDLAVFPLKELEVKF